MPESISCPPLAAAFSRSPRLVPGRPASGVQDGPEALAFSPVRRRGVLPKCKRLHWDDHHPPPVPATPVLRAETVLKDTHRAVVDTDAAREGHAASSRFPAAAALLVRLLRSARRSSSVIPDQMPYFSGRPRAGRADSPGLSLAALFGGPVVLLGLAAEEQGYVLAKTSGEVLPGPCAGKAHAAPSLR